MRILVAPDSFKGCLSSREVCDAITNGIKDVDTNIEVKQNPSSDGGEGFCDCMKNIFGGEWFTCEVTFPHGEKGFADYVYNYNEKTAFIELASAAGLHLIDQKSQSILYLNTFGVGELIQNAIDIGAETIYVGLGGSATNDCGIGLLSALGTEFLDENNQIIKPIPANLNNIKSVNTKKINTKNVKIIAACDVKNSLCGDNGAAKIFAKQKGASEAEIDFLDNAAFNFAHSIGIDPNGISYGAAGGVGAALIGILGAQCVSGAELLVKSKKFIESINSCDLIITGEGNTDKQTACGKLVSIVLSAAKLYNKPAFVISGGLSDGYEVLYEKGAELITSLMEDGYSLEYCISNAQELLRCKIKNIIENFKQKTL